MVGVVSLLALGVFTVPAAAKSKVQPLPPVARAYLNALARFTTVSLATADKLTASKSYADVYTRTLGNLGQASLDAGQSLPASTVRIDKRKSSGGLCSGTPEVCIAFSDFVLKSRKIVDFKRDGISLAGTLSAGDGATHDCLGSTLTVQGAYQPNTANLVVDVAVKNGDRQVGFDFHGAYIGLDGHQVQSASVIAPQMSLQPGSSADIAFVFPGVTPGGSVIAQCFGEPPSYDNATAQMPVPVYQQP
jgi:hypothetical protein